MRAFAFLLPLLLVGCGGSAAQRLSAEATLDVDGSSEGVTLAITRNSQPLGEYDNPCILGQAGNEWCRNRGFGSVSFTIQPSYTLYRVYVVNDTDSSRYCRVDIDRRTSEDNRIRRRSTVLVPARDAVWVWNLGIQTTECVEGDCR